ncbi:hypothetical protein RB195_007293 [Necator americanus]|uniref:Uncharacterized protein n=1 Tax=Necator americanus TaxID=51031 RepID=A0ABR1BZE4_NECAM
MVKIVRSYSWEEFHQDFLHHWIEAVKYLNYHRDKFATNPLLWNLACFAACLLLLAFSVLIMTIFGRVVDPRYPNLSPRRLSLWELFFTLQLSDSGNENEKLACKTIRTAVEIEKSAKPLADPTAKSGGRSAEVVAASHNSSEQGNVIVAETTKICSTPDKKLSIAPTPMFSAEKLLKESAKKVEPNSAENLVTPTSKELLSNERIALDEYKAPPTLSLAKTMSSIRSVQLEAKVTRSNETLLPPKYGSMENLNKVAPKRQSAEQLSPEKVPLLPLIAANKSSISAPP